MFCLTLLAFLAPAVDSAADSSMQTTQAAGVESRPNRPNVVIIYADDMGVGDVGALNPESKIPTPNLDRLAAEGLVFTDGHSSSGICTPSRYALLTGRHHWRDFHGIVQAFGPSVFQPERLTLPELFQESGYATACVGKWHLGWGWDSLKREGATDRSEDGKKRGFPADAFDWAKPIPDGPLAHGFEHYFGDDVPNFPPYTWIEDDRIVQAPTVPYVPDPRPTEGSPEGRPGPMVEGWKQDQVMPRLTQHAVEWIASREGQEEPFFLYFPWTSPHAPIVPAEEWIGTTEAGGYGDFVSQSDWSAGQVLEALKRHGFAENTIVVFTADNGPERYAYERIRSTGHVSMGPLRGLKRDIFEGGHRVPFIVRWPGVVAAGTTSKALVGQVDLMATFAAILDVELPESAAEDSFDLLPLWRAEVEVVREFMVHNTFADRYAIREGKWLLINAKEGSHSRVPEWYVEQEGLAENPHEGLLFDLEQDVGQRKNLFAEHPERVAEMRALLKDVRQRGRSVPLRK